jgi:predicted HNH restriction endonuclease
LVNAYERDPKARRDCIRYLGTDCSICKTSLNKIYGNIAKGKIEVHHLKELSTLRKGYEVDPIKDLIPLCPNCHRVAHMKIPAYTPQELKKMIKAQR